MQNKIEALEKENELLRKDLEDIRKLTQKRSKQRKGVLKFLGAVIAGKKLKRSILNVLNEYNNTQYVTRESISDVLANLIKRVTRIGVVTILFAMLPTILLWQQNRLIKTQNKKIQDQTYLAEASRRSSQMFIMGEVLSDINNELDTQQRARLSNTLVARIISLSRAMKPYRYIDKNDKLTKLTSPERGQLLIALCKSKLKTSQRIDILQESDFRFSELMDANLTHATLRETNLEDSNFSNSDMVNVDFSFSNLQHSNFSNADLTDADMKNTNLTNCNLSNANLSNTNLKGANLKNVELNNAKVNRIDWFSYIKNKFNVKGADALVKKYEIDSIYDSSYGKKFLTLVKR